MATRSVRIQCDSTLRPESVVPTPHELLRLKQKLDFSINIARKRAREADTLKAVLSDAYEQAKLRIDELTAENHRLHRTVAALKQRMEEQREYDERANRLAPEPDEDKDLDLSESDIDDDYVGLVIDVDVATDFRLKEY